MDSEELFENFNFNQTYKDISSKEDSKIFLSKKRNKEKEQDNYSNSDNKNINNNKKES